MHRIIYCLHMDDLPLRLPPLPLDHYSVREEEHLYVELFPWVSESRKPNSINNGFCLAFAVIRWRYDNSSTIILTLVVGLGSIVPLNWADATSGGTGNGPSESSSSSPSSAASLSTSSSSSSSSSSMADWEELFPVSLAATCTDFADVYVIRWHTKRSWNSWHTKTELLRVKELSFFPNYHVRGNLKILMMHKSTKTNILKLQFRETDWLKN